MRKIQAVIHLKSIYENARAFRDLTGKKICAVVKADAYGHGAEEVALAIESVVDVLPWRCCTKRLRCALPPAERIFSF